MSHEITYIVEADPSVFDSWAEDRIWNNYKPISKTTPLVYDDTDYPEYMEIICDDKARADLFFASQPPTVTLRFMGIKPHNLLACTEILAGVVGGFIDT